MTIEFRRLPHNRETPLSPPSPLSLPLSEASLVATTV
jgi:hypothetical protein